MKKRSCEKHEEQTIFSENGPILDQTFEVEQKEDLPNDFLLKKEEIMKDWASLASATPC